MLSVRQRFLLAPQFALQISDSPPLLATLPSELLLAILRPVVGLLTRSAPCRQLLGEQSGVIRDSRLSQRRTIVLYVQCVGALQAVP